MRVHGGIALLLAVLAAAACNGGDLLGASRVPANTGDRAGGTITGQVQSGGSGLGAVRVLLGTSDSTTTNTAGAFRFDSLAAATYTLAVRVPNGFALAAGETGQRSVTIPANGGTVTTSFNLRQNTTGTF